MCKKEEIGNSVNIFILFFAFLLVGCSSRWVNDVPKASVDSRKNNFGSIFGSSPIVVSGKKIKTIEKSKKCAVNKFLWRGALETIGFMPVISAIPSDGRIVTDWFIDDAQKNVRVKAIVLIYSNELRADGLKVFVKREKLKVKNVWTDYPLSSKDCAKLEILIVERARKIKNNLD